MLLAQEKKAKLIKIMKRNLIQTPSLFMYINVNKTNCKAEKTDKIVFL
tara:strand:+ start:330 stop:473 length:144 start_codon:yes stop_codon:yes gene_type:complete